MRRYLHIIVFSLILSLVYSCVYAQKGEALKPLNYNPVLANKAKEIKAKKARLKNQPPTSTGTSTSRPPLHVPFFDDFANDSSVYPNDTLWMDSCVYVNNTMCILPPSIGVATFDGLNKWGYPYNINNDSNGLPCDTLTSRPIDLSNEKSDTLRFFIQRGGNGEPPNGPGTDGLADSFLVEFSDTGTFTYLDFKGNDSVVHNLTYWIQMWDTIGNDSSSPFWQVEVAVPAAHGDTNFYRNNFQFRFRSIGNPSGNLDVWNLDYVRLDDLPAENEDMAMCSSTKSLLRPYYSMPYNVFFNSSFNMNTCDSVFLNIKNNDNYPGGRSIFPYGYKVIDEVCNRVLVTYPTGNPQAFNINPLQDTILPIPVSVPWTNVCADKDTTAHLLTKTFVHFSLDEHQRNDTAYARQDFNYDFAYDDGSAELGYGINNVSGGVAVQFNDPTSINYPDKIWAIAFHYNTGEDASDPGIGEKYFNIKIWSQINTNGNDLQDYKYVLYEWDGQSPHITDTLNGFTIYVLDTPIAVPDTKTFYVGWTQATEFFLNVGYDANYSLIDNDSPNTNVFVDIGGTGSSWQTSSLPGTPMIRAYVSTDSVKYYGIKPANKIAGGFKLYPNPSSGIFNLQFDNAGKYQMQLYNITGQMLDQESTSDQASSLDYSKFANGIYILRVINTGTGSVANKRIVISK